MKKISQILIVTLLFITILLGCKKEPCDTEEPCDGISEICTQSIISDSKEYVNIYIRWKDCSTKEQVYTVEVFDAKSKEVLSKGQTSEKSIIALEIPVKNNIGVSVKSNINDDETTVTPGEIIVGDIQCFKP